MVAEGSRPMEDEIDRITRANKLEAQLAECQQQLFNAQAREEEAGKRIKGYQTSEAQMNEIRDRLIRQRDAAVEALKKAQWGVGGECPVCYWSKYEGHETDCQIEAALALCDE